MRKFKVKSFVIIFLVLLVIEFLIVFADITLSKNGSNLVAVTDQIIDIFSLPISIVNKSLPFYIRESLYIKVLYWIVNLLIQSFIIYMGWRAFKRVRKKLK
ncbi:MAG: hypothetical protein AAFX55_14185 [Bacteroidota bacterium]